MYSLDIWLCHTGTINEDFKKIKIKIKIKIKNKIKKRENKV